jgi:hypothetical protein
MGANHESEKRFGTLAAMGAASVSQTMSNVLYRTLGKAGEKVSAIGLGGYHLGDPPDPADAIRIIRRGIDRGITFMDMDNTSISKCGWRFGICQFARALSLLDSFA